MKPTKEQVLAWARDIFDAQNWSDVQLARLQALTDRAAAYGAAAMQERCAKEAEMQADDEPYGHEKFRCESIAAAIRTLGDDE